MEKTEKLDVLINNAGTVEPIALAHELHDPVAVANALDARSFVLAGMVLALLLEFAVAPRIVARINLPLWHAVGSLMLLLQWLCAAVVFWRLVRPACAPASAQD